MLVEEAKEIINRARGLTERQAVEKGGSSHSDLNALLQLLDLYHSSGWIMIWVKAASHQYRDMQSHQRA